MTEHTARIEWQRAGAAFVDNRYSRFHTWTFDGGIEVRASSSPHVVRAPMSEPNAVDPEEAFVASLSSCHMLWFLSIAAERGFTVDSYVDDAQGAMGKDDAGRTAITLVTLHPEAVFVGPREPGAAELMEMHHLAHEKCFIANSVKSEVRCIPVIERQEKGAHPSLRR